MKKLLIGLLALGSISAHADCKIRFDAQIDKENVGIVIVLDGKPMIESIYYGDGSYQKVVPVSQTAGKDYSLSLVPVQAGRVEIPLDTKYGGLFNGKLKITRVGSLDILEAPVDSGGGYTAKAKFQDNELSPEQDVILKIDSFCFRKN